MSFSAKTPRSSIQAILEQISPKHQSQADTGEDTTDDESQMPPQRIQNTPSVGSDPFNSLVLDPQLANTRVSKQRRAPDFSSDIEPSTPDKKRPRKATAYATKKANQLGFSSEQAQELRSFSQASSKQIHKMTNSYPVCETRRAKLAC